MYFINESIESLQENVSESTYNDIMYMVEEMLNETGFVDGIKKVANNVADKVTDKVTNSNNPLVGKLRKTKLVANTIGKRAISNQAKQVEQAREEGVKDVKRAYNSNKDYYMRQKGLSREEMHDTDNFKSTMRAAKGNADEMVNANINRLNSIRSKYGSKDFTPNENIKVKVKYKK